MLALTCEPPSGNRPISNCRRAGRRGLSPAIPAARPSSIVRERGSAFGTTDHPLHARLQHLLAALVEHAGPVGDDAAVRLLRLALVRDLDLDRERVALEHRRRHAQLPAEIRHAGPVDEPGLHDEPLGEREGQGAGRGAPLEQGLARHVLHVHEERLAEPAQVHERHDVRLRHRAAERAEDGADLVLLEGEALTDHGCLPRSKTMSQTSDRGAYARAASSQRYTVSPCGRTSATPTRRKPRWYCSNQPKMV